MQLQAGAKVTTKYYGTPAKIAHAGLATHHIRWEVVPPAELDAPPCIGERLGTCSVSQAMTDGLPRCAAVLVKGQYAWSEGTRRPAVGGCCYGACGGPLGSKVSGPYWLICSKMPGCAGQNIGPVALDAMHQCSGAPCIARPSPTLSCSLPYMTIGGLPYNQFWSAAMPAASEQSFRLGRKGLNRP